MKPSPPRKSPEKTASPRKFKRPKYVFSADEHQDLYEITVSLISTMAEDED